MVKSEAFYQKQTGSKVDSVVKCWRNKEDPAARKNYKNRDFKLHNMHHMKKTSDMVNSMCQHEAYLTDKHKESPNRSRYDAELTISAPGLMDKGVGKSSLIYKESKEDFTSRHMNSPELIRNSEIYPLTVQEIERVKRLHQSKEKVEKHNTYNKSFVDRKDFESNKSKYFWEPSRERDDNKSNYFTASKAPKSEYAYGTAENIEYLKNTPGVEIHHNKPWNTSSHQQNMFLQHGEKIPKTRFEYVPEFGPLPWRSGTKSAKKSYKKKSTKKKNDKSSLKKKKQHERYTSPGRRLVYPVDGHAINYNSVIDTRSPHSMEGYGSYVVTKSDKHLTQVDNAVRQKGVVSKADLLKEWKKFVESRGGFTKITYQIYIQLVDEFKLYWYEKSHKELPNEYYEILDEFRIRYRIYPSHYSNERVVYVDGNGNYEDLPENRRTLMRFDSMEPSKGKTVNHDRKLIRIDEDSQPRNGYYSEVQEIQSPTKTKVVVDKQYHIPGQKRVITESVESIGGKRVITESIVSTGGKRVITENVVSTGGKRVTAESIVSSGQNRVILNEGHFVGGKSQVIKGGNSQIITTEEIVSPSGKRIVHGHKEVVSSGKKRVVYQDEGVVQLHHPGTNQVTYVKQPSYVYVDGDKLDNRHSYVVKTNYDHEHSPGKVRRTRNVKYDNVLPRVNTNLINDPNEVVREIQVDHGYKHDAELVFSPGKQVTRTSGVYATSKPLSHGHVGLNKVNPIYERVRNSEQMAAQTIQFAWKNRNNRFTGDKDQPQLMVHEEVSPTRLHGGRSEERTYTIADVYDTQNTMAAYVLKTGSPDRFNRLHHHAHSPAKKASEMTFNEFSKRYNQFENFKQELGGNISEQEAIKMFQDHLVEVSPDKRVERNSTNKSLSSKGSRDGSKK